MYKITKYYQNITDEVTECFVGNLITEEGMPSRELAELILTIKQEWFRLDNKIEPILNALPQPISTFKDTDIQFLYSLILHMVDEKSFVYDVDVIISRLDWVMTMGVGIEIEPLTYNEMFGTFETDILPKNTGNLIHPSMCREELV